MTTRQLQQGGLVEMPCHLAQDVSSFIVSTQSPSSWDPMLEVRLASEQLGSFSPEQQCERLALNEIIAEGASGTVYRGRWRNMDVAVKVGCGVVGQAQTVGATNITVQYLFSTVQYRY